MVTTAEERRDSLVSDLIKARQEILSIIQHLPPNRLDEACIGMWCVKDLLAHLIGWDYTNLQAAQEILAGQRPAFFHKYDKDWQSYNSQLVKQYRVEPFAALLDCLEQSQRELVNYLRSLPAEEVLRAKTAPGAGRMVTLRGLLRAEAGDERTHAGQLRQYFGG